jgi:hypothetical protein
VEGITRITGYFTKVSSWNKGKLGELRDRHRSGGYFSPAADAIMNRTQINADERGLEKKASNSML